MDEQITPIRQQYLDIKAQYPNCMLLFRLGDFYETFDDDAIEASRILNIVLTKKAMGKGNNVPMAGIPFHAIDDYLSRLIKEGHKVAICEQITKPGETKGIVQREVVRVVTSGTIIEPTLLETNSNNYLASVYFDNNKAGFSYIDISTGEFKTTELDSNYLVNEISRIKPKEILISENQKDLLNVDKYTITECSDYNFIYDRCEILLKEQLRVATLDGFGLNNKHLSIIASGAIIKYLQLVQKNTLGDILGLSFYSTSDYMILDDSTQKNLELFVSSTGETKNGTLLSILDHTCTPMGGRLIRQWIGQPLLNKDLISNRLDSVEALIKDSLVRSKLKESLKNISDIERLSNRINSNIVTPRELNALKNSLKEIATINETLINIEIIKESLPKEQNEIIYLIENSINDPAEGQIGDGITIKNGLSNEYDNLLSLNKNSKAFLLELEAKEKENTGINKLRIGYNNVFGYYIEVPNGSKNMVPDTYIRKQTLVNVERFYTPELKEFEVQVLNSKERISELEHNLYNQLIKQLQPCVNRLLKVAQQIAYLDVIRGLSETAISNNYVKPLFGEKRSINIINGRHPIVESRIPKGAYVPNDTSLNHDENQIMVITGPNMAGKSTYMKQVALIVLMAQIGSFVPADKVELSITDRIFTRIGAHEELSTGKSTFMVEMVETSNILNNATNNSLLLLDEIGRGTSTYDGLSIAEAVVEYIHNAPNCGALTMFATHYHEMVELENKLTKVKNFNIAVSENHGEIVLLHKIIKGGTDKSYGIHVANLAGLPRSVTIRANEILIELENKSNKTDKSKNNCQLQLPLFREQSPIIEELANIELDSMTPINALNLLYELKNKCKTELDN